MADSKKYYWLKLNVNFFDKEEIKLIEGMPNGKDYIIFYMKLLLKSANTEGRLMFRDVIPYTVEMLSSITNTNFDTVKSATEMFIQLGMMERLDDGALFMAETQNMIGSETEFAKKKREYREKIKQNKTLVLEDNSKTKKDNVRQEIEKDIEIEKDRYIENEIDQSRVNFKENIRKYMNFVSNVTNRNVEEINRVINPQLLKDYDLNKILSEISESDFLQGKCDKKPSIINFTRKNMIDRIILGEYRNKQDDENLKRNNIKIYKIEEEITNVDVEI